MSKSFDVPQAVRRQAQRGLDLRKEHGRTGCLHSKPVRKVSGQVYSAP